jgi:hypothetical protein
MFVRNAPPYAEIEDECPIDLPKSNDIFEFIIAF